MIIMREWDYVDSNQWQTKLNQACFADFGTSEIRAHNELGCSNNTYLRKFRALG